MTQTVADFVITVKNTQNPIQKLELWRDFTLANTGSAKVIAQAHNLLKNELIDSLNSPEFREETSRQKAEEQRNQEQGEADAQPLINAWYKLPTIVEKLEKWREYKMTQDEKGEENYWRDRALLETLEKDAHALYDTPEGKSYMENCHKEHEKALNQRTRENFRKGYVSMSGIERALDLGLLKVGDEIWIVPDTEWAKSGFIRKFGNETQKMYITTSNGLNVGLVPISGNMKGAMIIYGQENYIRTAVTRFLGQSTGYLSDPSLD